MKILAACFLLYLIQTTPTTQDFDDPEKLVQALYQEVTFDAGEHPDWEFAKSMFLDDALVVLRYGPNNMTVFSLKGWVDDFVAFIETEEVKKSGFQEIILGMKSYVYGDIASVNVLFESHIPGTNRRNKGVDIFQLVRKDSTWKIVSIINERPAFGGEIPDIYH